ncbi:hypothetical protein B0H17DRAFT_1212806 [Mycena rosella]|uniref:Uncharacterized protein n=1 Tax=Mycena rosella TaxID=1033263 RepID=A0AAD7CRP1_MYCRO|nr:hypothetical protein B0H17DRAFT_1212806 [Mycena rosella]
MAAADPAGRAGQGEVEWDAMVKVHVAALQIIAAPLLMAKEGLMTCAALMHGLVEFSGWHVCGLRLGDLIEEFWWLTQIPLDAPGSREDAAETSTSANARPPWIQRAVREPAGDKERERGQPGGEAGLFSAEGEAQQTTSFNANPNEFNPKDAQEGQGLGFDVGSSPTRDSIFGKGAFVSQAFPGCRLDFRDLTAGNLARMREVMRFLESVQRCVRALQRSPQTASWAALARLQAGLGREEEDGEARDIIYIQ